ncbi:alpha-amylase family glycosyl hydrolase [Nafulsella turpanensis]|uniref:alpha-amylase family glycosyl hydrolase n=1 Tax=Nafulsella turpanensis TaxID=1265690 RepID=UPI00034581F4|nr:alpha-amylase family glycosyl hydrolase [Nafulsella turpanensis]
MKKIYPFFLIFLFFLPSFTLAQVVTTDPEFPSADQAVTLTFDLKQATDPRAAALLELSQKGEIFLWSGAGDENDAFRYTPAEQTTWSAPLPEPFELTPLGNDIWQITLTPSDFYPIPEGAEVTQLGLVLKNATGSAQTENFYVDLYPSGFNLEVENPEIRDGEAFTLLNSSFPLSVKTSEAADIQLYLDGAMIKEFTNVTAVNEPLPTSTVGTHQVRIVANTATETKEISFSYQVLPQPNVAPLPEGVQPGLNVHADNSVTFVLTAPQKEYVLLLGDFNNFQIDPAYQMNVTPDGDTFWLKVPNLDPNTEYAYYYLVDGEIDIADPFSELVLDAQNDQYIDATRYPGLRPFPAEAGTDRLSVFKINEDEFVWQAQNYTRPEPEDLIIYELLTRDFTTTENFQGIIDRLDYLDSLNITAIQLLPVMEFNGNDSWGYNPTFMTAVDKWYGPAEKLKELIDLAHQRGIAVILDITLNHQDFPSPFLKMWWEGGTAAEDNPFFNPVTPHPLDFFTDLNHESVYTQAFVDQVTRYWLEEFNIDGFRFDLSKGFTQKETNDYGPWAVYDASRIAILKRMADEIWEIDSTAYLILEHFADNSEETELANYGFLLWGNMHHSYGEAIMGWQIENDQSDFSWISYQERGWEDPNLVGYFESHDEERQIYKALEYGNSNGAYSTAELATALDRVKLAAAFFIPVPGPKMIWQFGELGYDVSIDFNGRVGKKPIRWEYADDPERAALFHTMAALNHLKTTYPVFETESFEMPETGAVRTLKLFGEEMDVVIVGNFGLTAEDAVVSFPQAGLWWSYFSGDSLQVNNTLASLELEAGEFHVFFSEKLVYEYENPTPFALYESPTAVNDELLDSKLKFYPNPAEDRLLMELSSQYTQAQALKLRIIDQLGRIVIQQELPKHTAKIYTIPLEQLQPGHYLIEVSGSQFKEIRRIIVR